MQNRANFSVHHMFWLQNRPDKLLRIKWPLNYTLQHVLHAVTLTGRYSVFRLFVRFGLRFKYSLFFDRRQVHSVPRLERRQTCALDPSFNFKSNCTQVTSITPHKKGIFRHVSKQQRRRSLSKRKGGGGGAHQRVFYRRVFPVHWPTAMPC